MIACRFDQGRATNFAGNPNVCRIAELAAIGLADRERCFRPLGNQTPLLLGERGVEMQHERVRIAPEFGNDERDPLRHESSNECNVARETIQLRKQDAAFGGFRGGEGGRERWAAINSVGAPCFRPQRTRR